MAVIEITPRDYITSTEHRSVADAVMAKAGELAKDVAHLVLVDGRWMVTVFLRDANGKRYLSESNENEIASKVVWVDPVDL